MDRIDVLLKSSSPQPLSPSVKQALKFARAIINKYYSKTDLSNVYRIAMGKYQLWLSWDYVLTHAHPTVLHPNLKLRYFQTHGWEKDWVDTAEAIVREDFAKYYEVPWKPNPASVRLSVLGCNSTI
jgi:hypothetical protein